VYGLLLSGLVSLQQVVAVTTATSDETAHSLRTSKTWP
jgi:hypothetical protein